MIKAVFFDFDGVIVESVDVKTKAFGKLFEPEGALVMQQVTEYHLANTGVSRFEKFRTIYKEILKRELTDAVFEELCGRFSRLVTEDVVNVPYVDGALPFLKKHFSEYTFFVVSATPQKEIEHIIARRQLKPFFKKIHGAPTSKKDAVRRVLSEENLKPSEALYIGDAVSDYEAAKANGVKFVARISGDDSLFSGKDCPKVKDLENLDQLINQLSLRSK